MKRTNIRIFSLLFAVLILLNLTACGKEDPKDPNHLKIGSYELVYKSAKIVVDYDGNDALVVTMDYTNNSKEATSYLWSFFETATQDGNELETATIFLSEDSFDTITDSQFTDVAPGETLEIQTAYVLPNTTGEVHLAFEDVFSSENGEFVIDPSTLSREESTESAPPEENGEALLAWWNGDWYGWWTMTGCTGSYEELEDQWWDICGSIDIGDDMVGTVTLWDEDYTKSEPMVTASVTLNEEGTGESGTLISEGGWFMDVELEHADWLIDPALQDYTDMIRVEGSYENGQDTFSYDIILRPWGTYWDDVNEEDLPYYYTDWYLPLIEADESMPDSIEADPANTNAASGTAGDAIPTGEGIVTDEQVQKGYVYMSEVAKDIYNTTYPELAAYFGVDGQFVKEEYSDHMEANYRYYKWISSENPHNFIYVNFMEEEPGIYKVSAFNTSGFSGSEAKAKYLDIVKAEAAELDKENAANTAMKDFSLEIKQFAQDDVKINILTTIPESGWSYTKDSMVENEDPTAFGAGAIRFKLRESVEALDSNKDSYKNYAEIEDRVIGGITFKGRTYEYIGYDWIEYVAQIDDTRALSIGLTDLDCVPGTFPDLILNNMTFQ